MKDTKLRRRDVLAAGPIVLGLLGLGGLGRSLLACSSAEPTVVRKVKPKATTKTPTDEDEYEQTSDESKPAGNGAVPTIPNLAWEARVKQLEGEQKRLYGEVFSAAAPGVFAGKERSHVPTLTVDASGKIKKATILVEHVMGNNKLDAGTAPPADAAPPTDAAAPADAAAAPPHYITTMWLRAMVGGKDSVVGLWEFTSTDPAPPSVVLALPEGITSVVAYEWCSLHGMWKSEPEDV